MKHILTGLLFSITITCFAQSQIEFQNISMDEAKKQAISENKLIFLDGFTSWCAPCKWMDKNIFTQTKVAKFFNQNFINTKFDCEKGEGIDIAKKYAIRSFPTYLFIDSEGTLVYRTHSRMDAESFLNHGKRALDTQYQIPYLESQYSKNANDPEFLLRYIAVMKAVNPEKAKNAEKDLLKIADNKFLKSENGWEIIYQLANRSSDRYGQFFINNKEFFREIAPEDEFKEKEEQFLRSDMYAHLRSANKDAFFNGLQYFKNSSDSKLQIEGAMYEIDWMASKGLSKDFLKLTNAFRKTILKNEDDKLSFIARRYSNLKEFTSPKILKTCYKLAKQAVGINQDSYSNQATLAELCIKLNKKREAIHAASEARRLAELETSKIIGLADKLLDRAKSL